MGQLNDIKFIENPDGLITCGSSDKLIKLWSLNEMSSWGVINLNKEHVNKHWKFPFDWSEMQDNEIMKVKELM